MEPCGHRMIAEDLQRKAMLLRFALQGVVLDLRDSTAPAADDLLPLEQLAAEVERGLRSLARHRGEDVEAQLQRRVDEIRGNGRLYIDPGIAAIDQSRKWRNGDEGGQR